MAWLTGRCLFAALAHLPARGCECDFAVGDGRKRIVAPDGSEIAPTSKPQPDGTLVKALARAWRWQRMLESGEYGTLAELADADGIRRSYVCRIVRLTLLAPDIVERILEGRLVAVLARFSKPFQVARQWRRERFC